MIEAGTADKVKALTTALGDGQAARYVIEALEGFGRDAAPALPALKKLKLSPNDGVRNAPIKAIEKDRVITILPLSSGPISIR